MRSDFEHVASLCVSTTELRHELEQGLLALEIEFEEQDMVILRQVRLIEVQSHRHVAYGLT